MVLSFLLCLTGALDDASLPASFGALPDLRRADRFDGIDPVLADHFWDKWRLVTVRYRSDNGEQRFVYANDVAFRALSAQAKSFPKGAMFAKVAFATAADPAFPASLQPSGVTRVQLMQKDAARWRYAIYPVAMRGGGDEKTVVAACDACHTIVKDRDFVFSTPAFLPSRTGADAGAFAKQFTRTQWGLLSAVAKNAAASVGVSSGDVFVLAMPLFIGALSESEPVLVQLVRSTGAPHVLYDEVSRQYVAAAPEPAIPGCKGAVKTALVHGQSLGAPIVARRCSQ